jgi:hypothetical protein
MSLIYFILRPLSTSGHALFVVDGARDATQEGIAAASVAGKASARPELEKLRVELTTVKQRSPNHSGSCHQNRAVLEAVLDVIWYSFGSHFGCRHYRVRCAAAVTIS